MEMQSIFSRMQANFVSTTELARRKRNPPEFSVRTRKMGYTDSDKATHT